MSIPAGLDLSNVPLTRPPPGHVSNFVNPKDSLADVIFGVSTSMTIVTAFVVIARLIANMKQSRKWFFDDFLCVSAFALFTTYTALEITLRHTGRHEWDVPISVFANHSYSKRIYAMGMVFGPGMTCAKCAILALYLRIFQVSRTLRVLIWIGVFVICSTYLVAIPVFSYYCTPRANENWDLMLLGKCKKNGVYALIQGVIGVGLDVYIFILPLPTVLRLRLPRRKKIGVVLVFVAGLLGIAAAALSLVFRVKNWQRTDTTWNAARVYICVVVEAYTTVIVSCAPSLAALWRNTISGSRVINSLRSLLSSHHSSRSSLAGPLTEKGEAPKISALAPVSRFTGGFDDSATNGDWSTASTMTTKSVVSAY